MNRLKNRGFTIIEAMIVLAVTSAMFIVAMLAFNGQQERTRFTQGTRDFESKLRDVANDIRTGYFSDTKAFTCNGTGTSVTFTSGTNTQGTNESCIFLGKAVQLTGCTEACTSLSFVTVAGKRQTSGKEVTSLTDAKPTVAPSAYNDDYLMQYGLRVTGAFDEAGNAISGIALLTSLASYDANDDPIGGSQSSRLFSVPTGGQAFSLKVAGITESNLIKSATVCLANDNGSAARKAVMTIGDTASGISTELVVDDVPEVCNV